jgi:hypothetical protein
VTGCYLLPSAMGTLNSFAELPGFVCARPATPAGADVLIGLGGNDTLDSRDGVRGNDRNFGGAGTDTCRSDSLDVRNSCERRQLFAQPRKADGMARTGLSEGESMIGI